MEPTDSQSTAWNQLVLVLSFFPRVDSRVSVLIGVDIGMLGVLAARVSMTGLSDPRLLFASIPALLLALSLWHLYQASFPDLRGGEGSLIYFSQIATCTESKFIERYKAMQDDQFVADVLGQVWRNSQILDDKYRRLKDAFRFMSVALVFWLVSVASFAR